jgi:hypothetical protein
MKISDYSSPRFKLIKKKFLIIKRQENQRRYRSIDGEGSTKSPSVLNENP